ncbi:septum formation initiator family protein [Patescibacteria group bacterium]|nr:septum formation initiator family protein [Patescibacteria group bacterium]MBU1702911.1 septum formation initiator family protein [Patescibacteria group bacterium]MBU1954414.1 septum formation initiator family protein [Patescibacteria group bacterium]
MAIRFQQTSSSAKLVIVALLFLVSYLLFTLTSSVYKSHQLDVHISNFEAENARIEEEIRTKSDELGYYNSDAYIEKIAKQNLGLVNPGEEVIIIPNDILDVESSYGDNVGTVSGSNSYESLNNPQRWWKFFFDTKR